MGFLASVVFSLPDIHALLMGNLFMVKAFNEDVKCIVTVPITKVYFITSWLNAIHTLCVYYAHAVANLNSGYAKVARVHYFYNCTPNTLRVWCIHARVGFIH